MLVLPRLILTGGKYEDYFYIDRDGICIHRG
jgi:hypothetical protein